MRNETKETPSPSTSSLARIETKETPSPSFGLHASCDHAARDQADERQDREQRGHGERGLVLVLVVEDLDVKGQGVGAAADVAGDHGHGAELAHRAGGAQDD